MKIRQKKIALLIGVSILALASVGITYSSNLTINSNKEVEFGKGKYEISACQSWIGVNLDNAYFNQAPNPPTADFYLNKVSLSGLDPNACKSTNFKLKFYMGSGSSLSLSQTQNLNSHGGNYSGSSTTVGCGLTDGSMVIVGARIYKNGGTYVAGIKPICEDLSLGGNRTYSENLIGIQTGVTEDLSCPSGSAAAGLYVREGSILDAFGLVCKDFNGVSVSNVQSSGGGGGTSTDTCSNDYYLFKLTGFGFSWYGMDSISSLVATCAYKNPFTLLNIYDNTSAKSEISLNINSSGIVSLADTNTAAVSLEFDNNSGSYIVHLNQPLALMSKVDKLALESSSI